MNGYGARSLSGVGKMRMPSAQVSSGYEGSIPSFYWTFAALVFSSAGLALFFQKVPAELLVLVTVTGALVGSDAFDALRGRRDIFSPRSLVSVLMVNGFYIAPLLHVIAETYPQYIVLPRDMPLALSNVAMLNLVAALLYFLALRVGASSTHVESMSREANDAPRSLRAISHAALVLGLLSLGVFLLTVLQAGGPAGWLSTQFNYREDLASSGVLLSLSEPFPTLFMISALAKLKVSKLSQPKLGIAIAVLFVLVVGTTFVTSGLRGSRANLVWPLLSMLVLVHVAFFSLKKRWIVAIALTAIAFAGVYDVYKKTGTGGVSDLRQGTFATSAEYEDLEFGPLSLVLGDFSRTGVQAVILDRSVVDDYSWGWGSTYLGGVLQFVPGVDAADIVPTKSVVATNVLYGEGAADVRDSLTTRIYGLQGEALLNFGPVGFVLVLLPFAALLRVADARFHAAQVRQRFGGIIIASFLTPALMLLFVSDLDNVVRYVTSKAMLPILVVPVAAYLLSRSQLSQKPRPRRLVVRR